jgi:hypothetical protein
MIQAISRYHLCAGTVVAVAQKVETIGSSDML